MGADVRQERVRLSDGVDFAVTLFLPETLPAPVLLEALPYRKDDLTAHYRPEYLRYCEEFGYAVARADIRGTGSSGGIAADEYAVQEQRDLTELIGWLSEQSWSTGAVGMFGTSYSAFNALQLAMADVPALRAVQAIYGTDDRYTDDVHYRGGVLRLLDLVDYPLYMVAMNALPPVPAVFGARWREEWSTRLERTEPWLLRWLAESHDGPYWRHGSVRPAYDAVRCPVFLVVGWADGYRNNSFRTVQALRQPWRLLAGPWSHLAPDSAIPGPHVDLVAETARWWDRWLREDESVYPADEPAAMVFVRRWAAPEPDLAEQPGRWVTVPGWPPGGLDSREFPLGTGDEALVVEPDVGVTAWIDCAGALPWGLPGDQRRDDARSVVTDFPVTARLAVAGHGRLRVSVAADVPVAFLSAKLCDVAPDGRSALVTRGFCDLSASEGLAPSPFREVELELDATAWEFLQGHRVRLSLAGTDWPTCVAPPRPVTLTFRRDGGALTLPVLPGGLAEPVLPQPPPRPAHPEDDAAPVVWRVDEDVLGREVACVIDHGATTRLDDGTVAVEHYAGRVSVDRRTFSQRVEASARFALSWPEARVSTEARLVVEAGDSAYDLDLVLEVRDGEDLVSDRRWRRRYPR